MGFALARMTEDDDFLSGGLLGVPFALPVVQLEDHP
ncbi:hypothetical protein DO77_2554 [Brucella suis]|nr:hypothetical protein DK67_1976 [Brucella suis bv. 3 str. 686]KFJ30776.1 hypothetical protein DO77_2554 [Brucella suis]KFJ37584.1 hypothetical protein DK66_3093 [Brucella suis 1330]KFJ59050.1 hypothetical protein DK64_1886 [Brucella neotomae 5K33]AIJ72029.1 hypothetical protein DK67_1208 [Brucella suis bv. 3 str. 686]